MRPTLCYSKLYVKCQPVIHEVCLFENICVFTFTVVVIFITPILKKYLMYMMVKEPYVEAQKRQNKGRRAW